MVPSSRRRVIGTSTGSLHVRPLSPLQRRKRASSMSLMTSYRYSQSIPMPLGPQ